VLLHLKGPVTVGRAALRVANSDGVRSVVCRDDTDVVLVGYQQTLGSPW
jgi:hypothetical protein